MNCHSIDMTQAEKFYKAEESRRYRKLKQDYDDHIVKSIEFMENTIQLLKMLGMKEEEIREYYARKRKGSN